MASFLHVGMRLSLTIAMGPKIGSLGGGGLAGARLAHGGQTPLVAIVGHAGGLGQRQERAGEFGARPAGRNAGTWPPPSVHCDATAGHCATTRRRPSAPQPRLAPSVACPGSS